ncbi:MAG TPA: adenosine deaminase, partial [Lautropia sp.]|nr:adenosine deaminase [Lautropia sp.]
CWAYLLRAKADGVVHTEIFFDPQTHTDRGVRFETVLDGLEAALKKGQAELGIGFRIIMCFLRHLPEEAAFKTLAQARPHASRIAGVGLDSSEKGNPPSKFAQVFDACAALGWHLVAHAGEEGPPEYVIEALDILKVERIDHGVRSESNPALMQRLAHSRVPLTVCPLSNVKLRVFPDLASHNLKRMLHRGVNVTINSDDPAYFGGYLAENYIQTARALNLGRDDVLTLARNSLESSFASKEAKAGWLADLQRHQ